MKRRCFLSLAATGAAVLTAGPTLAGGHRRLGSFAGASGHATTGTAGIAGDQVNLLDDFTFDGAPDPKVALGRNGCNSSTLLGALESNAGASSYTIPAGLDPADYDEVWIWCERYDVPLGVAKLS